MIGYAIARIAFSRVHKHTLRVRSRQLIFSKKSEKLLFSRALKARSSHSLYGTNALLKHKKKVTSRFFWKKISWRERTLRVGSCHEKSCFFWHVKLRSSRVSKATRE